MVVQEVGSTPQGVASVAGTSDAVQSGASHMDWVVMGGASASGDVETAADVGGSGWWPGNAASSHATEVHGIVAPTSQFAQPRSSTRMT